MSEIEGQVKEEELDAEQQARRRLALAQIRQYPDAALKMAARPVEEFDDDLRQLVDRMKQLMVDANGIGLAATQVGVLQRLFVFQASEDETVALANPEIVERSEETTVEEEGCLSIQGVLLPVERPTTIAIAGQDEHGADVRYELEEPYSARRPARVRPSRRRPDPRPDDARGAARGAREPAPAHRHRLSMARRIAVAATAPFGADVLERLAAEHDVVQLLTRPDRPRGRGRKLAPPPAKEVARAARDPGGTAGPARRLRRDRRATRSSSAPTGS